MVLRPRRPLVGWRCPYASCPCLPPLPVTTYAPRYVQPPQRSALLPRSKGWRPWLRRAALAGGNGPCARRRRCSTRRASPDRGAGCGGRKGCGGRWPRRSGHGRCWWKGCRQPGEPRGAILWTTLWMVRLRRRNALKLRASWRRECYRVRIVSGRGICGGKRCDSKANAFHDRCRCVAWSTGAISRCQSIANQCLGSIAEDLAAAHDVRLSGVFGGVMAAPADRRHE